MFNKVILIGRLGQNAEAKTAQNNREYAVLNIATQESWKKPAFWLSMLSIPRHFHGFFAIS